MERGANNYKLRLGPLEFCFAENTISSTKVVKTSPKSMDVLKMLVENDSQLIARDELLNTHWPGRFGADESLSRTISELRKALRTALPGSEKALKTVPKRGYRFDAIEIETLAYSKDFEPGKDPSPSTINRPQTGKSRAGSATKWKSQWLVSLLLLVTALIAFTGWVMMEPKAEEISSIVVLPFSNLTGDEDIELLADGVVDEIISRLHLAPDIDVASRSSSFYYKNKNIAATDIAKQLDVTHLLEGSIRQLDGELKLNIQLTRGSDGIQVWSENHTFDNASLHNIQLETWDQLSLSNDAAAFPAGYEHNQTLAPSDYATYLKAMHLVRNGYITSWIDALPLLEQLVQNAPDFSPGYTALAASYIGLIWEDLRPETDFNKVIQYLQKAEDLGADDVEFLLAKAARHLVLISVDKDRKDFHYQQGMSFANKALEIDDTNAIAYLALIYLSWSTPETSINAQEYLQKAIEVNSLHSEFPRIAFAINFRSGQIDDAEFHAKKTLALAPNIDEGYRILSFHALLTGNWFRAYVLAKQSVIHDPYDHSNYSYLTSFYTLIRAYDKKIQWLSTIPDVFFKFGARFTLHRRMTEHDPHLLAEVLNLSSENLLATYAPRELLTILAQQATDQQLKTKDTLVQSLLERVQSPRKRAWQSYFYRRMGKANWQAPAKALINEPMSDNPTYRFIWHWAKAEAHAVLGESEQAIEFLVPISEGLAAPGYSLFTTNVFDSPLIEDLRGTPVFDVVKAKADAFFAAIRRQVDDYDNLPEEEQRRIAREFSHQ